MTIDWQSTVLGPQAGRTFVVTGANSGIGFAVARALVIRGAHAVLVVRDTSRGALAAAELQGPGSTIMVELDLADLDQVASAASTLLGAHDELAALICNAGVMGGPLLRSAQGHERQMATSHLGHAALVVGLWPLLDETSGSRVGLVSSGEARAGALSSRTTMAQPVDPMPYDGQQVYRNTKQAKLLFALELHRRCRRAGSEVSAVAVHPGIAATNLLARQLDRAGRQRLAVVSTAVTAVALPSAAAGSRSTLRALHASTASGAFVGPAGRTQLRGRPVLLNMYASALTPGTAEGLWDLTEQVLARPRSV